VSELLEAWVPRVYRFALRLTQDAHAADDLTQETFLRAWRHRDRLREPTAARVWLFRIAANLWRDQLRRGRSPVARAGPLAEEPPDPARPAQADAVEREDLRRALEAMDGLPARQREVLYLSACEGLPPRDIAAVLQISPEAAKASLSLARKRLRELLPDLCEPRSGMPNDDARALPPT
jgi:RNA polymerase sigma-70 factor, ECF subfamily